MINDVNLKGYIYNRVACISRFTLIYAGNRQKESINI